MKQSICPQSKKLIADSWQPWWHWSWLWAGYNLANISMLSTSRKTSYNGETKPHTRYTSSASVPEEPRKELSTSRDMLWAIRSTNRSSGISAPRTQNNRLFILAWKFLDRSALDRQV